MTTVTVAVIPSGGSVGGPWTAAVHAGGHVTLVPLGVDRLGQPDLRPLLDLLAVDDRAGAGRVVVVLPRLDDRDEQAFLSSHIRCSVTTPARMEMLVLGDGEVTRLLDLPDGAVGAFDPAALRPVIEQDLGVRLPADLDGSAVRAVAWLVAGKRELARRAAQVRVIGVPRARGQQADPLAGPPTHEATNVGTSAAGESESTPQAHMPGSTAEGASQRRGRRPLPRLEPGALPPESLLSVTEIMQLYGVSRSYVYGLRGQVPCFRFGGLRFRRCDLEAFLHEQRRVGTVDEVAAPVPAPTHRRSRRRRSSSPDRNLIELRARYGLDKV